MNIYNDDEQSPFAIYQTEIGSYAIGDALTNDALLALCRDQGDSKGNLKIFVSHASASVHEPPPSMEYTMPPPVLPHIVSINPLRLKRRSRSRNGSFSSTSENLTPEVAAGYEADLDYPDRETNKSTARACQHPSQHLIAPPAAASTVNQLSPRRHPNHNRPSSPLIQNPEPVSSSPNSSDRAQGQRKEDKHPHALPAIPTPPQPSQSPSLSPNRPSFTLHDEPLQNPIALHSRTGSDADADRLLKAAGNADNSTLRPDNMSRSRLDSSKVDVNELLPSRRPQDDDDPSWEIIPSNIVQRSIDEQERVSPTISRYTRQQGISRYRPSSPYATRHQANRYIMNNPPTRPPPAVPSGLQEVRTTGQTRPARLPLSHNVFVTWKGEEGGNRKASPAAVPTTGSRLGKTGTKSMDNLKLSFSPSSNRRNPLTRPPGAVRDLSYAPNTVIHSGIPKSYEPPRPNFVRPMPASGSSYPASSDIGQGSSMQYTSKNYATNLMSPSQDPFPRPQSATGDPLISPTRGYTRVYSSTLDSGEAALSPRTVSPHRTYHSPGIPGPRPRPTHHSDRSDRSSDIQSGPETTNSTPPRTPISPQSPRYDPTTGFEILPLSSLSTSITTSGNRTSDTTLKQEDHVHFANLIDQTDDKTHVIPGMQPQTESLPRQLTPPPPLAVQSARNSFGSDSDEDSGGGTWIRRPDPGKSSRPPLKVQIDNCAASQRSADTMVSQDTLLARQPSPTLVPRQAPKVSSRPGSTFIDADSDSWAPRPPAENIYDRLDQFFSKHDLDKPVIEAASGDTSPTTAEPLLPPPNPVADKARIRAKKSIRIVAEEHKKRINRTSMADPAAFTTNALRKRNTKLWGSKLEEVTTFRSGSTVSLPESPSGGPSKGIYLVLLFITY